MRNKKSKRTTSTLLAVCLTLTLLLSNQSFSVFAEEDQPQPSSQEEVQSDDSATEESGLVPEEPEETNTTEPDKDDAAENTEQPEEVNAVAEENTEDTSEKDVILDQEYATEEKTEEINNEETAVQSDDTVTMDLYYGDITFSDDIVTYYEAEDTQKSISYEQEKKYRIIQTQQMTATSHTISVGTENTAVTKSYTIYLAGVNIDAPKEQSNHKAAIYVNTAENTVNLVLENNSQNTVVAYAYGMDKAEISTHFTHSAIEKEINTEGTLRITCEAGLNSKGHNCTNSGLCGSLTATAKSNNRVYWNGAGIGSKGYIGENHNHSGTESTSGTMYNLVIAGGVISATGASGSGNGGGPGIGIAQSGPDSSAVGYNAKGLEIDGGYIIAKAGNGATTNIGGGFHSGYVEMTINGGYIEALRDGWNIGDWFQADVGAAIGGGSGGSSTSAFFGTKITINGGTIKASAAYGAAIGSSAGGSNGDGAPATIIINGGIIEASTSKGYGAAIGTGGSAAQEKTSGTVGKASDAQITINGGTITASSQYGADIGGGGTQSTKASAVGGNATIHIEGGTITTTGNGLGGGLALAGQGGDANITISGGTINTTSIGGGDSDSNKAGDASVYISEGTLDVKGKIGGGDSNTGAPGAVTSDRQKAGVVVAGGTLKAGTIGGGTNKNGDIGFATVDISGGDIQGQFILANTDEEKRCFFTMTGGTIDNSGLTEKSGYQTGPKNGGAVYLSDPKGVVNISGGTIKNSKGTLGGAVYMTNGTFNLSETGTIFDCEAENGGAVYLAKGILTLAGGIVSNNMAASNGGGFYAADGAVRMFAGKITGNHAGENGGGFYISSAETAADVVIRSGEITSNTSGGSGAGIAVASGEDPKADKVVLGLLEEHEGLDITETSRNFTSFPYTDEIDQNWHTHASCPVLKGNIADGDGGGIYMQSSAAILNIYCLEENGNISKENANGNGVMMAGGNLVIGDKSASGNTVINSAMLVEGGKVDIWGNMNNPLFEKNILVDIKNGTGEFEDHREQAVDDVIRYKIHYFENFKTDDSQDASGIYIAEQYDEGDKIDASGTLFEHVGWRILGWATKEDKEKGDITYSIGANIANEKNHDAWKGNAIEPLVLYAIWTRNIYTVKFKWNSGTYSGEMENQTFSYGVEQKLAENQYKVRGKRFTGWNTKEDGTGTAYEEGYSESKMTSENGATVKLFAQWVDCTHNSGDHPGTLNYTINEAEDTIIETCDCGGHTASISLVGQKAYHDGNPHTATKNVSGTLLAGEPTINYKFCSTADGEYKEMESDTEPTEVGFYEASITVGEKTISVKYQIQSASSTVSVDAECIDGQRFGVFSGNSTCSTAKDDAFTVRYSVQKLAAAYDSKVPLLIMNQNLPEGTTIIMQTDGSYWYKNIETETEKIELSAFSKMGGSEMFAYTFKETQEYRFVFDFSKVAEEKQLSGSLEVKLQYQHNSSDNDSVSDFVTITLDDKGPFGLSRTADSLEITAPPSKAFSRWQNKNLILSVTAANGTAFPADAKLIVKSQDKTYTYSKNTKDMFVVPITWSSLETISMSLESDLVSSKGKGYTATVNLCVGDAVENLTDQPQAEESETKASQSITLQVPAAAAPSLKIEGTQKVLKRTEKLNLMITMGNVDACTVHATIQQKETNGYSGKFLDTDVTDGNNHFNLGAIKESGSYRLLITVTKEKQELLEVPYYFVVQ